VSFRTTDRAETIVAHANRGIDHASDVAPPIHQTATFRASSDEKFAEMASTPRHARNYARDGDPTFNGSVAATELERAPTVGVPPETVQAPNSARS
jgi:cystathionine beta-lyase/cystathionine gamma-synthase